MENYKLETSLPIEYNWQLYSTLFCTILLIFTLFKTCCSAISSKKQWNGKEWIFGTEDIPGDPTPFGSFIGNILIFLPFSKALQNGMDYNRRHGGLAKFTAVNQTFIEFFTPDLCQQLFKSTDLGHGKKSSLIYDTMKPLINNGVLVSTKELWQRQRKILTKTQNYQNVKAFTAALNKHCKNLVGSLEQLFEDGKPHQINNVITVAFLRIICEMITGSGTQSSKELDAYHRNFQLWKASLAKRSLNPWLLANTLWNLHPMAKSQKIAIKEMEDFAIDKIRSHRQKRIDAAKRNRILPEISTENLKFRNVLDELFDAGIDEKQTLEEVNTMLFGGHGSGSSTMQYFAFCMALNPTIQRICQQEIDELFESATDFKNGEITYDAVTSGLKYLERCINETMRLYPAVFVLVRELETPLLIYYQDKKYLLPVGVNVSLSAFVMHRNPEYFPDPETFDPDRFLPEKVATRHPCAFIPFSGGPRNCLGIKFAMMEMKMVAAYILRQFTITTTDKVNDIALLPFTTLTPERDYTFRFQKRNRTL